MSDARDLALENTVARLQIKIEELEAERYALREAIKDLLTQLREKKHTCTVFTQDAEEALSGDKE